MFALQETGPDYEKTCVQCGELYRRKYYTGRGYAGIKEWRARKFCRLECYMVWQRGKAYKRKDVDSRQHRRYMEHVGVACEACGLDRKLHAHHIDGDYTNNVRENIQTLCAHCHGFWHALLKRMGWTYGAMPKLF